ncbi:MAG: helix-turn-helix domain-containing protein [Bacteroidota bacterium]
MLSIALEAGFNSKSSFNRAVKKHLGISPSELKTFSEDSIS